MTTTTEELFPGNTLTLVLLDQSESMGLEMEEFGLSLAEATTSALNLYLQKVAQIRITMPELFANRDFGIAIIGYGSEVDPEAPLVYIDSHEVRADSGRTRHDGSTISSDAKAPNFPIWLLPAAAGGARMHLALTSAMNILEEWLPEHRSAGAPQIINVTSGDIEDDNALEEAEEIKTLSNDNGNPVVWTCHIAAASSAPLLLFPRENDIVSLPERLTRLSRSSSPVPQRMIRNIFMEFPEVSRIAGARTCALNANLATLVRMLSCASRLPLP